MGKGGGCVPSSSKKHLPLVGSSNKSNPNNAPQENTHVSEKPNEVQVPEDLPAFEDASSSPLIPPGKLRIFIVFYSMYGHVEALAKKMKEGIDGIEGVEGSLFRVPEILSPQVLEQMHAPPKDESIPVISATELPTADGLVFGFPTRYGSMAAQMKAFFDSTGQRESLQAFLSVPVHREAVRRLQLRKEESLDPIRAGLL